MAPQAAAAPRRRRRSRFASAVPDAAPLELSKHAPTDTATATRVSNAPEPPSAPITLPSFAPTARPKRRRHPVVQSSPASAFAIASSDDASSDEEQPVRPSLPRAKRSRASPPSAAPAQPLDAPDPLDDYMSTMASAASRPRPSIAAFSDSDASSDGHATRRRASTPSRRRAVYEKVDHSSVRYPPFQKALYIEVPELSKMTHAQVASLRRALGHIRIRGRDCPRPITSWAQCGLSSAVLDVLRGAGYDAPTGIQAQAVPCIMSGRDVIGVARTGSGKTLAFLLPLLRHIALQPRAEAGEGPAALVVAPTRELAIQIYGEARRFGGAVGVKSVCAYGGSGVKDQIAELKRGADIVICTPGRMIDLLAMNSGRITNLRRVTYVVLDEADRMFDMGFEPQLTRIVENVRPDKQTVMFSATFPMQVEKLARKVLKQPVEIMVGGNSVAAASIEQHIEVRGEDSKFFRLLELLGHWYGVGSTLVFVDRQENADRIFRELFKAGYKCHALHGGMDQADRDSAIVDFKNATVKVLVATSVAARGLDVKNLTLVVNFDVPSHYEDYVHRVGRTGRAGRAGTAYTFITPDQEAFAPDMVKALESSARAAAEQEAPEGDKELAMKSGSEAAAAAVPENLRQMADAFLLKKQAGIVRHGASSGYGGRGFSFDNNEDYVAAKAAIRKMQAKQYGIEDDTIEEDAPEDAGEQEGSPKSAADDDDDDDGDIIEIAVAPKASGLQKDGAGLDKSKARITTSKELTPDDVEQMLKEAAKKAEAAADRQNLTGALRRTRLAKAKATVLSIAAVQNKSVKMQNAVSQAASSAVAAAQSDVAKTAEVSAAAAAAAAINAKLGGASVTREGKGTGDATGVPEELAEAGETDARFAGELEINDYPQHARWQVTRKNSLSDVEEFTGCVITTRGNFYPPGRNPPAGERKLHFLIEGPSKQAVKTARRDIRQKLEEAASVSRPSDHQYSKYSVV